MANEIDNTKVELPDAERRFRRLSGKRRFPVLRVRLLT